MLRSIDPEIMANTTATLATITPSGSPQLTIVWFLERDGHVLVSINAKRAKARNVRENPACSVLIQHPDTADYFVEIRGTAALIPDEDYSLSSVIGERYDADFRSFDQPGDTRFVIDITPTKVLVTDVR